MFPFVACSAASVGAELYSRLQDVVPSDAVEDLLQLRLV